MAPLRKLSALFWTQKSEVRDHFSVFSTERFITGESEGIELQVITTFWADITVKRCCCVTTRVAGEGGKVNREAKGLSWGFGHLQGIRIIDVSVLLSLPPWQQEKWMRTGTEQMYQLAKAASDLWGPQMKEGYGSHLVILFSTRKMLSAGRLPLLQSGCSCCLGYKGWSMYFCSVPGHGVYFNSSSPLGAQINEPPNG